MTLLAPPRLLTPRLLTRLPLRLRLLLGRVQPLYTEPGPTQPSP